MGAGDIGTQLLKTIPQSRGGIYPQQISTNTGSKRRSMIKRTGSKTYCIDLDRPHTMTRLPRNAVRQWHTLLYTIPPPIRGLQDTRTRHFIRYLESTAGTPRNSSPRYTEGAYPPYSIQGHKEKPKQQLLIYLSTSGVYGDCKGEWVTENRPVSPATPRAFRRVDAERQWIRYAKQYRLCLVILRVPGIYSADRLSVDRVKTGQPVLLPAEDVYTNHIHADDLVQIIRSAMYLVPRSPRVRIYNVSDDSTIRSGDYWEAVARHYGFPPPPRTTRDELSRQISDMALSFLKESRRLNNQRMKRELKIRLYYPTVEQGLKQCAVH